MAPASRENPKRSLAETLHEAPAILEALSPEALKSLSSTCKTLRTLFCAQISTITLSCPGDASKICCTTWPNLLMVVCPRHEIKSKLPAQWEYMMNIIVHHAWPVTAVLIRSQQQPQMPLCDFTRQHCAVLSEFTDKHRCTARKICLQGPLVGCKVLQFLTHFSWPELRSVELMDSHQLRVENMGDSWRAVTAASISHSFLDQSVLLHMATTWPQLRRLDLSNNQLDTNVVWALTQVKWTHLESLSLSVSKLGSSDMQHLVSCSWPSLGSLALDDACIDAPALQCLAQGQWPELAHLSLKRNRIDVIGIFYLLQGCWPRLYSLSLSVQGLDAKAYSLLGMTDREKCSLMDSWVFFVQNSSSTYSYRIHIPYFPQFPQLQLFFDFK